MAVDCSGVGGSWRRMWWREVKAAMRPAPVVVADVLGKDSLEVSSGEREDVVQAVLSDGAHPAFGERVRVRGAHGGEDGFGAHRGEDVVEAGSELGIPVADEEPHPPVGLLELGTEVACHLGHPGAVRVGGHTEEMHDAAFHFDDEQHVVVAEQHGVNGEEVGRHDALGLGAEELGPAGSDSTWCWGKPMAAQDVGDAALRDADTELLQLAGDAQVAPAGVLPGQTEDQLDGLPGQGGSAGPPVRIRPTFSD